MTFETDREREVYESELEQCGGMVRWKAERHAEHAVKLHRQLFTKKHTGPAIEDGRKPKPVVLNCEPSELVRRLFEQADAIFGAWPKNKPYSRFSVVHSRHRWFAMTALYHGFGSHFASNTMDMTDAGIRGGDFQLKKRYPEAYAAALRAGEQLAEEQKGKAA